MRVTWFVFIALMSFVPSLGMAQPLKPPNTIRPNGEDFRVMPGGPAAPLPSTLQSEPSPRSDGETAVSASVTLAELEEMAERCNPTLAQAAARAQCLQVGLYPNPVVGYLGSEIGNSGRAGQQGGFIGQEVVTAGKLRLNRAVAGQEIHQAEYAWATQRFRSALAKLRHGPLPWP